MQLIMKIDGIILLNKPEGITSFTAVQKTRRLLSADKAGHLGTLDPMATGVLPIALGKATKLFDMFLKKDKEYEAVFFFGEETDTLDREGQIINTKEDTNISLEELKNTLKYFVGKISQMPPKYSAKKINGKKAYELARAGKDFQLAPKEIEIYNIEVISQIEKNKFSLRIQCSSGTYIRSLVRDIAYRLGTYGTMYALTRTRCGVFNISNCYSFNEIELQKFKVLGMDELANILEN